MPTTVWKGYISFGLIAVPVRLYSAARYSHVRFHEIHRKCGTRVRQQLYCPYDKEVVPRDEIGLGYQIDKDKYVLVEPAEVKKLQPSSSTVMEILQFAKSDEVDPIYYETSYFSVPEEAGARAYALLLKAMEDMSYAAIAKITLHQRERAVVIRPYQNGLILHTIYYPKEIHEVKDYGKTEARHLKKQEVDLAEQFAKSLVKPFRPEQFHDDYSKRVEELIESKSKGQAAPKPEKPQHLAPVIDLMSALKKSLTNENKAERGGRPRRLRKTA
jgi:DNA end-binding protein Ku